MVKRRQQGKRCNGRMLSLVLSAVLAVTTCAAVPAAEVDAAGAGSSGLSNPKVEMNDCDAVYFGHYLQEDTNGDGTVDARDEKQPIRWRILSQDGDDAYVIADKVLDNKPYHSEQTDVTWETCTLRQWLNEDFYNTAFTEAEQNAIIEQTLVNADNEEYGTSGGNQTGDKVFLPSLSDMKNASYGFSDDYDFYDQARIGKATQYAKKQGVYLNGEMGSLWWLRSPGGSTNLTSFVYFDGGVSNDGSSVCDDAGIRPALHVNLSSPLVTKGEKVETSLKSAEWDTVELGTYDGKPITWRVLSVSGQDVFLLSDRILTETQFHGTDESVTWENSALRSWLNGEFYQEAFTAEEQKGIIKSTYTNEDHPWYGIDGGSDTEDYVTLLSLSDIVKKEYGFPTDYGCGYPSRIACDEEGTGSWWWLRSTGDSAGEASHVGDLGCVYPNGRRVSINGGGVRPALHVNLSMYSLTKKGTVRAGTGVGLSNPVVEMNDCDMVYFGHYLQEDTNGDGTVDAKDEKLPIRWRILSQNGDDAYVIADKVLDSKPYHTEQTDVTWETCTLRQWLNEDFYNTAFTEVEQNAIIEQALVNADNEEYGTSGGNQTEDKVYLPSLSDLKNASYGFSDDCDFHDQTRIGKATQYAKEQGVYTNGEMGGRWWLRSSGDFAHKALNVNGYGSMSTRGDHVDYGNEGVRPALHVNLSSPLVTKGEKREVSLKSAEWDTVEFGTYDGKPVTWRVLSVSGQDVFLLSDRTLTDKKYHDASKSVTWETSTLRSWLNGEFYQNAFTAEEQKGIIKTTYTNKDNSWYETEGGNDTEDYVTLLSLSDIVKKQYGFPTDYSCEHPSRIACDESGYDEEGRGTSWWLRSPGRFTFCASDVLPNGSMTSSALDVQCSGVGVRPALHVNLSAYPLTKKGTVRAEAGVGLSNPDTSGTTEPPIENSELKKPRVEMNDCDTVYFGHYLQEDTNGDGTVDAKDEKWPIRWRILSQNGDDAYVIADKVLDRKPYHTEQTDVTWETCTLRQWLNEDFYNAAFTEEEQNAIIEQTLVNADNGEYGTFGGNDTKDRVYLPSLSDMKNTAYGFSDDYYFDDQARIGKITQYAKEQGVNRNGEMGSVWWLRSPGEDASKVSNVGDGGFVYTHGDNITNNSNSLLFPFVVRSDRVGIRPALHINLSSPHVTKGEKVETSLKGVEWDTVELGTYDGKPVTWRVLSVSGQDVFLLSERILTEKQFHDTDKDITWENSALRSWLNGEFYQEAFTGEEQKGIIKSTYTNEGHPWYGTGGGSDTEDYVTLLSLSDIVKKEYGFPTDYCCGHPSRVAYNKDSHDEDGRGRGWWLRSLGYNTDSVSSGYLYGGVEMSGCDADNYVGVRPALHVNLSAYPLTKKGTVRAGEGLSNPDTPDNPNVPNNPDTPDDPNESDNPDTSGNPNVPNNPDTSSSPNVSNNPDTPGSPNVPNNPDTPGSPNVPNNPDTSGSQNTPNVSGNTTTPDNANTPTVTPGVSDVKKNSPTKINIKNRKTCKTSKKITIKDADGIKQVKLNSKTIKGKGKKRFSFRLSKYKKYLKKAGGWNKLAVTDKTGKKKTIKFKTK